MRFSVPGRAIPAVVLVLLAGCFRSSGLDDEPPADMGPRLVDMPFAPDLPIDSGPDLGASPETCNCCGHVVPRTDTAGCGGGICDPWCLHPFECRERPLDALCDYSHVTAGQPTALPVLFGGDGECFCAEQIHCTPTVLAGGAIELTTQICADPGIDCDACEPFVEGVCNLPPLTEGAWQVFVNGEPGFMIGVESPDVFPEIGSVCISAAGETGSCDSPIWPPRTEEPASVCHPSGADAGTRVAIDVTLGCPSCTSFAGPCNVNVFDDVIHVAPTTMDTVCELDCPPVCTERVDTCLTPELPAGTWRVQVAGLDYEGSLVVGGGGDPAVVCSSEPFPGG